MLKESGNRAAGRAPARQAGRAVRWAAASASAVALAGPVAAQGGAAAQAARPPAVAAGTAGGGAAPASAGSPVELAGVKFDRELQVGGSRLLLNGAGVRYRAVFRVYAAGLYLTAPAATPKAVLETGGPRRLHIVMLREIDGNELGRMFVRGMEQNATREDFAKAIPGTIRMGEIFSTKKRLLPGESFQVDWLPGQGTQILINGQPVGEPIREPQFYSTLMKLWLGDSPVDGQLKDALLGISRVGSPS